MGSLPGIFSLIVGIAGWYYLFYSRTAEKLGSIEAEPLNRQRARLRRLGGFMMLLLAIAMYAGFYTFEAKRSPGAFMLTWIAVFVLLLFIVLLALLDLRLTARLRRPQLPIAIATPPMKHFLLLLLLSLVPLVGCHQPPAAATSGLPTVTMPIGSKTYTLEIAAKTIDRNKGLMYRDSMPEDHGMIFIFAGESPQSFWMHNTRIPLDILYLDTAGRVVSIHRMEAYDERATKSKAAAKYAIELNAGQAGAAGAKEGDVLKLPEGVKNVQGDPQ